MKKVRGRFALQDRTLAVAFTWVIAVSVPAWSQTRVQANTDRASYNVGEEVSLRIVPVVGASLPSETKVAATVRYAGDSQPVPLNGATAEPLLPSSETSGYGRLWKVPLDARTGRYEIDLVVRDPTSHQVFSSPSAASFTVHRKLVHIEGIRLDKTFYTSGDPVACTVTLRNVAGHELRGLRVEFSDRYWPWIAGPAERAAVSIVPLATALDLPGPELRELRSERAAVAAVVKKPSVHQFGVVVWDRARKEVLDIAFSQLTFVQPPGVEGQKPYPGQYLYPDLSAIKTTNYRHFYPPERGSGAIEFDDNHTMFEPGSTGTVNFTVVNRTSKPWRKASIRASLLGSGGSEVSSRVTTESADLDPGAPPLAKTAELKFPSAPGLYRAKVDVRDASGESIATGSLELGVNPLPKSILIFCAHEDDEGGYSGLARAAVENHIPIHYVYFTSGDAGSCDRYYEHSCSPDEALNFGGLRMDETRASLGHLGVPRENLYFLGLPDGGSGQIWYGHTRPSNPFLDPLLATDHAPYEGLVHPNLPYSRDSVVETVKELIKKFQPEVICTAHPQQVGHIDHIVNNYFVVKALQELLREKTAPPNLTLLVDKADPKVQPPAPYHYQPYILYVPGEVMALAQEAWWFYQSQGGGQAEVNMRSFDQLPRTEDLRQVIDWQEHEGWNENP